MFRFVSCGGFLRIFQATLMVELDGILLVYS